MPDIDRYLAFGGYCDYPRNRLFKDPLAEWKFIGSKAWREAATVMMGGHAFWYARF